MPSIPLFTREPTLVSCFSTFHSFILYTFFLQLNGALFFFLLEPLHFIIVYEYVPTWLRDASIRIPQFFFHICFLQLTVTYEIAEARISLYPLVLSLDIIHRSQM